MNLTQHQWGKAWDVDRYLPPAGESLDFWLLPALPPDSRLGHTPSAQGSSLHALPLAPPSQSSELHYCTAANLQQENCTAPVLDLLITSPQTNRALAVHNLARNNFDLSNMSEPEVYISTNMSHGRVRMVRLMSRI
jgi:hypothetical protein